MGGDGIEDEDFASQAGIECISLAQGLAGLVKETSGRDTLPALGNTATSLAKRCQSSGLQAAAELAETIARGANLLFEGQVDPGQAILLLASATETLHKSILGQADKAADTDQGLIAARYELETLFPVEGQSPKPNKGGPDVTLHRLRKR